MKKGRKFLMLLAGAVFLFSAGMVIRQQIQYRQIAGDAAEAAKLAGIGGNPASPAETAACNGPEERKPEKEPEETPAEKSQPLPEEAAGLAQIDLQALKALNEDVVGWIAIPDTQLSYPLMQGTDNQYYMTHNWKGEPNGSGSVFLESTCSGDMTDFHTIAYAHRMRDGSMFGTLKYYADNGFLQEHPCVYAATDAGIYRYDIFSAHEVDITSMIYRLDLEESGLEEEFLQASMEKSFLNTDIVPTAGDRILTLSTCTGSSSDTRRWVVHSRLAYIYPADSIRP